MSCTQLKQRTLSMRVYQHVHCNCRPPMADRPSIARYSSPQVSHILINQSAPLSSSLHAYKSRLPEEASYKASSRQTVVSAVMHNQPGSLLQPLWVLQELEYHGGNAAFLHVTAQGSRITRILHSKSSSVQTTLRQEAVNAMSCTV